MYCLLLVADTESNVGATHVSLRWRATVDLRHIHITGTRVGGGRPAGISRESDSTDCGSSWKMPYVLFDALAFALVDAVKNERSPKV